MSRNRRDQELVEVLRSAPNGVVVNQLSDGIRLSIPRYNTPLFGNAAVNSWPPALVLGIVLGFVAISYWLCPTDYRPLLGIGYVLLAPTLGLSIALKTVTVEVKVDSRSISVIPSRPSLQREKLYLLRDFEQLYCEYKKDYFANIAAHMSKGRKEPEEYTLATMRADLRGITKDGENRLVAACANPAHAQFLERIIEVMGRIENYDVPGEMSRRTDQTRHLIQR